MDLKNFTVKSQESIQHAQQLALGKDHQSIENGHILKGILDSDDSVTPFLLKKLNVNIQIFTKTLDRIVESYPKVSGGAGQYLSQTANLALAKAQNFMKEFGDEYVSIEHLLLGI